MGPFNHPMSPYPEGGTCGRVGRVWESVGEGEPVGESFTPFGSAKPADKAPTSLLRLADFKEVADAPRGAPCIGSVVGGVLPAGAGSSLGSGGTGGSAAALSMSCRTFACLDVSR